MGPADLALIWLAGLVCDELAVGWSAAGRVLTRFTSTDVTSTDDFWGRLGGFEAGAGDGDSRKLLAFCAVKLSPEELFPELEKRLMGGGVCWTPVPSTEDGADRA